MVTAATLRKIALALPEVTEEPHFEKASFRVAKKIFATLAADSTVAMAKLTKADQDIFCTYNKEVIYPVPNKWGDAGATFINLNLIEENRLQEIIKCAYKAVAPPKLGHLVELV